MDTIENIKRIYFLGIGGIGMSALASYFFGRGVKVAGYDRSRSDITDKLSLAGIEIVYEDAVSAVPAPFLEKDTLVVYTPAIPGDNPQLSFFRTHCFEMKKRSEVLGIITRSSYCVAVAGTHGKTTTSAMTTFVLRECGRSVSAFVGGIMRNYDTNYLIGDEAVTVVEADEFDRSFLQLSPDIAVINAMDADHLDIYGTHEEVVDAFRRFAGKLKPDGKLITRKGLPVRGITFAANEEADYFAHNIRVESGHTVFDLDTPDGITLPGVCIQLPGKHNVENATAALAVADRMGVPLDQARDAIARFEGIKRRFNLVVNRPDFVLVDDYAHHPAEIAATVSAARDLFPGKKITGVFQPHLFTRTRDFADDFAIALSALDQVMLLDIYPARERPIEGITSEWLLSKITCGEKSLVAFDRLVETADRQRPEVLLMMGAGDITDLAVPIKEASEKWVK